ncbi:hypothetical protein PM082_022954 [Marasmius tenuissimus]|nr:hypothetical protein PM082_022954 [Marasmius tenuissimus]
MILEASLEHQFRDLILNPDPTWNWEGGLWGFVKDLSCAVPSVPNVIVIDGLDECGDEPTQLRILSIIRSAFQEVPHLPLRFLICSRPESWIREAFVDDTLRQLTRFVALDDAFAADRDIERYYLHHFQEIISSMRYGQVRFPNPWPSREELKTLIERTCGQFVYAATIIKFIRLAFSHPMTQLRIILENTPTYRSGTSPYHYLDGLYEFILGANPNYKELLPILAAILVLPDYVKSPACIELVLGLPTGQVALALRAMHSVLNIGDRGDHIELYHTSFRDCLINQTRSRHFHIDIPTWTNDIARRWLRNLTTSKIRSYSFDQLHDAENKPFFIKWMWFCRKSTLKPSRELLDDLWNVDLAFLYFVEGHAWEGLFKSLDSWVKTWHSEHEHGISRNEDDLDLMDRLTRKFQHFPGCFHLEWPPSVSPSEEVVYHVVNRVLGYGFFSLCSSQPSTGQWPRLTDCDCDLSGGNQSGDISGHWAYQEACLQISKLLVSHLEKLARSAGDGETLFLEHDFFELICSPLLQHCCLDTELVSLCRTFLELVKEPSALKFLPIYAEKARKGLLAWVETFPDGLSEEREALKAQIIALPWGQWVQAYNNRRASSTHNLPFHLARPVPPESLSTAAVSQPGHSTSLYYGTI